MPLNESSNTGAHSNIDELYKKHRIAMEGEVRSILSGKSHVPAGAFEDFVEDIEKKLMITFDAFVSKDSHSLASDSIKISQRSKRPAHAGTPRPLMFPSVDLEYARLAEEHSDRNITIEVNEGESKNLRIALSDFHAPLVSKINIIVHKGASLKLFELFISDSSKPSINLSLNRLTAEEDSTVEINVLHNEGASTNSLHFSESNLARNSRVKLNTALIGSKSSIVRNLFFIEGEGAYFEMNSSMLASKEQKFDVLNNSLNSGKESTYFGDVRAVLSESSVAFLKDMSSISPHADDVKAYIKERAMIIGERARVSMLPDMSINENNVKATHSAASAPIDTEGIFYLMSRGLTQHSAESMVLEGFLSDSVSRIDEAVAKSIILAHIYEKIRKGSFGSTVERNIEGMWLLPQKSQFDMFSGGMKAYGNAEESGGAQGGEDRVNLQLK